MYGPSEGKDWGVGVRIRGGDSGEEGGARCIGRDMCHVLHQGGPGGMGPGRENEDGRGGGRGGSGLGLQVVQEKGQSIFIRRVTPYHLAGDVGREEGVGW